jgi:large subunit ribosomal protein L35
MPKIKTVKSAAKRISKITKNGKIMRLEMSAQHLARRKSKRAKAKANNQAVVHSTDSKKMKRLVPYI